MKTSVWCGPMADQAKAELAVLRRNTLLILEAATGAVKRSTDLGADNYAIVRGIHTRKGNRLLIQNTEKGYAPYEYGLPALVYDASDLRLMAAVADAVGSGHSPRVLDINGDGNDEILIGFDAYDADGRRLWRLEGNHRDHVDQLQVGRFGDPATAAVVYAASKDVEMGTLAGRLLWKQDFDHPQDGERPAGPGPDSYGVRIADLDNDGRAEVLIHDQAAAWIYQPPNPQEGTANTHRTLEPVTGQGWYAYDTSPGGAM